MSENEKQQPAKLFEGTLYLSPNIDYFQNGDDFFVYHNLYGYILKMSEDLVDFLEFFYDAPRSADEMVEQFGQVFDNDTLNEFLSIFRTLACLLPDESYEPKKSHDMYPTQARWITVDSTDASAVVIYAFDTQAQNRIIKISLDAWESRLWAHIEGKKTVGEIAEAVAEEDGLLSADVEMRIVATLALGSHCSIQAVKMSAEPCANFKGRRFGVPPYLISTMPYEKVTVHVRTKVDENGAIIETYEEPSRPLPQRIEMIEIAPEVLHLDRTCTRLSSILAKPHDVLAKRSYGEAIVEYMEKCGLFHGSETRILEIGGGNGETARDMMATLKSKKVAAKYTIFCPDSEQANILRAMVASEAFSGISEDIVVVDGDIEKIAQILGDAPYDIIFSDEFLANLPSANVRKMSLDGGNDEDDEDEDDEPLPDGVERDIKPAHLDAAKLTFIGEGDSVNLIMKHRLNLCDAPEDFILNTGSIRLIEHINKLATSKTHIFLIEFGEDIKYPVLTLEDGQINYSQHFGVLKQVAQKLGYTAESHYWMEEIGIVRDMEMFATTRSQFKAMRQMLVDHGVELERRAYRREEFEQLLERAGRTSVVEVNYEHAEDRISGLVPHAYKVLHMYHEEEVGTDIGGLEI